jgi:GT2 family glycosyltransferase
MSNFPISFCIGTCNNLNYLKLAIHSVRTYSHFKDAPLIIFAENCTDGTDDWLQENKEKYNLEYYIEHNPEDKVWGIGGGMNYTASKVKTEYIMFLHADFFVAKNWDLECLKIFEKYPNIPMWVFSQRFQPNLWKENSRPGTIVFDLDEFGYKHDDFNEQYFIDYAEEFSKLNPDIEYEKGEGVSGLVRTKDFWDVGGVDYKRYRPSYWEDKDLWFRLQLAGYKIVLTSNSVVFHFGSRSATSNFPDDNNLVKADSAKFYEQRSGQAFFKKWGFWPVHNQHQFDVLPPNIDKEKYKHLIRI